MSSNPNRVAEVQRQVDEVTSIMHDNIDQALANQDKAEDLVDRTDELSANASMFKKQSTSLKRAMCCQNAKLTMIIIALVVLIVAIIVIVIVVVAVKNSGKKGSDFFLTDF